MKEGDVCATAIRQVLLSKDFPNHIVATCSGRKKCWIIKSCCVKEGDTCAVRQALLSKDFPNHITATCSGKKAMMDNYELLYEKRGYVYYASSTII